MQKINCFNKACSVILMLGIASLFVGCASLGGGRYVHDSYKLGLESEQAKDFKTAITHYDDAIKNFESFGDWMRSMQYKGQYYNDGPGSLLLDSNFMQHRAYRHRAYSKKQLGDIAGHKADLALAEKQEPLDIAMYDQISDAANEAQGIEKKASAKPPEDAKHCLSSTWENTCDREIVVRGTGSMNDKCNTSLSLPIGPGQMSGMGAMSKVCTLNEVSVHFAR
ncbi:MAG: hypothetical protein ABL930_12465 [Pseudobdellovibrio sp.]